jgi:hypothetical protein
LSLDGIEKQFVDTLEFRDIDTNLDIGILFTPTEDFEANEIILKNANGDNLNIYRLPELRQFQSGVQVASKITVEIEEKKVT